MGPTWDKGAEGGRRAPRAAHPLAGGPQLRLQRAQALAQHAQLRGRDPRFRGLPVARPALLWVSIGVRARPVRAAALSAAAAVRSGPRPAAPPARPVRAAALSAAAAVSACPCPGAPPARPVWAAALGAAAAVPAGLRAAAPPARPVRAAALGAAAAATAVPHPGTRPNRAAALLRAAAAPANPGISIRRASAIDLAAAATPSVAAGISVGRGHGARRAGRRRREVGRAAGDRGRVGARQLRAQARGLVLKLPLALPSALHRACARARRLVLARVSCSSPGLLWRVVRALPGRLPCRVSGASAGAAWLQRPQEGGQQTPSTFARQERGRWLYKLAGSGAAPDRAGPEEGRLLLSQAQTARRRCPTHIAALLT